MSGISQTLALTCATTLLLFTGVISASGAGVPVEPAGVNPAAFEPAYACGCHGTLVEDWQPSMHAQALSDPLYLTKLAEAEKATGGTIGPFCNKCHGPGATMTGEMASGKDRSDGTNEGVNCSFCHQVIGLKPGIIGNTSHLVDPSGVRRAQIKEPKAPHAAEFSELHTTAEFCGGCHNVLHPVNGMHLEATYKEWSESPYAKEGIVCQDCHMSIKPGVVGPTKGTAAPGAPERDNIYQMTFVGANVAQGPAEASTALLKSAAEIRLEIPEIVPPGETTSATVTITNVGAGHYLPTGLTEVREMWLEVTAATASGETTTFGTHVFGTILQDDKGNAPVELWEAAKIKSDDRIGPRESVTYSYAFTMPEGATATSVTAALYYKSASDEFAEKAKVANPVTQMAVASSAVYADDEAARQAAAPAESESGGTPTWVWLVVVGVIAAIGVAVAAWWKLRSQS